MTSERGGRFFVSGGTLPVDSPSYIERAADRILYDSLIEGRYCYVLNSRQIGKSSLSVHTLGRLRTAGIRTAYLDLTRIGGQNITPDQWYMGIALEIARELGLSKEFVTYWRAQSAVGPMQRFFGAVREVLLAGPTGSLPAPLVVFIDEIDATKSLPFDPDEFFAGIRECFNKRVLDPAFTRLTFCLIGVAVPGDLVRNPATTPFNIGERIPLVDFTRDELANFAPVLGSQGEAMVGRIHYWTGGHPFLSQSLCRALANSERVDGMVAVDDLVERELFDFKVRASNINLADVANIALHYGDAESDPQKFRADLLSTYGRVLAGKPVIDDESNRVVVVLKLSGIVRTDGRRLAVRNRIYRRVFDRAWIEENMPGQELRRQRQSFRRGATRAALVAGIVLATVGVMAFYAWSSNQQVIAARAELDYRLYAADINSLSTFFENGDTGQIEAILKRQKSSPYRGFEWHYWLSRFHDAPEEYSLNYEAPGKQQEGHISGDGRLICVVDNLIHTATVVERSTKRTVKTVALGLNDRVLALHDRFVILRDIGYGRATLDLMSQRELCRFGSVGWRIVGASYRDHSDIIGLLESNHPEGRASRISIWRPTTGTLLYRSSHPSNLEGLLAIAAKGHRIMYAQMAASPAKREMRVFDWGQNRDIDRFEVPDDHRFLAMSPSAKWIAFATSDFRTMVRDVARHTYSEWRPSTGKAIRSGMILNDEKTLIALMNDVQCRVNDFPSSDEGTVRENVSSIFPGSREGEFLAGATSVRVYRGHERAIPKVVAQGWRVTRFSRDRFNLFRRNPEAIDRISEAGYGVETGFAPIAGLREYTYNGRYSVVEAPDGQRQLATSTEPKIAPRLLPFVPAIWSSAIDPDHFAFWSQGESRLAMMSLRTGEIRWEWKNFTQIQGMWVSPDGSRLLIIHDDLIVRVYDTSNGKMLAELRPHNIPPINVTFASDGRRFFTCGGDGRAVMWDLTDQKKLAEFRGNALQTMTSADLSPDGRRVVTTSRSGSWQLWDATTGVQFLDVSASKEPLSSALFLSDGRRIVTAGDDGQVRAWSTVETDPTIYLPADPTRLAKVQP